MNATKRFPVQSLAIASALFAIALSTSGCAAIGGVFKAGAWVGVVVTLLLFALVGGAFAAFRRR